MSNSGAFVVDHWLPDEPLVLEVDVVDDVLTSCEVAANSFCCRSENPIAAAVTMTVTSSAIHLRRHTTPT